MLNDMSVRFSDYLAANVSLSETDQIKIRYTFQMIFGDLTKLLILMAFFQVTGKLLPFLLAFLALQWIRPFTGGIHLKTYWGCLVFSIVAFSIAIFLKESIPMGPAFHCLVLGTCMVAIHVIGPQPGKGRPNYSIEQINRFKRLSLWFLISHIVLVMTMKNNPYSDIATWVVLIQTLQLLFKKGGLSNET